ncbi:hypothetical protein [uncultured Corynebacterium sp.]|uniref:hypothetical protein n=1 Tax=uncultured Corynebacterium sp. TaxID=159447 RepID=UPI0025D2B00F|nr:hypothetical protein [uncultured Corynebacterium sp.]
MKFHLSALAGAVVLAGALAAGCTSDDSGDAGDSSVASTTAAPDYGNMGVAVKGDGTTVTVNAAYTTDTVRRYTDGSWTNGEERPSQEVNARENGTFVVVETTVTNDTDRDMDLTCHSTGGYVSAVLQTDPEALYQPVESLYEIPGNPECNRNLGSGFDAEMTWVFEIPADREATFFNFRTDTSDKDATAFIRLDKFGEKPSTSVQAPEPTDAAEAASHTPEVVPDTQPAPQVEQYDPDPVFGFTGAPGVDSPHQLDKEITSCGDTSIHEVGTTFFTDGTSGWTSTCAAQMG